MVGSQLVQRMDMIWVTYWLSYISGCSWVGVEPLNPMNQPRPNRRSGFSWVGSRTTRSAWCVACFHTSSHACSPHLLWFGHIYRLQMRETTGGVTRGTVEPKPFSIGTTGFGRVAAGTQSKPCMDMTSYIYGRLCHREGRSISHEG